jgi:hypothetical protein
MSQYALYVKKKKRTQGCHCAKPSNLAPSLQSPDFLAKILGVNSCFLVCRVCCHAAKLEPKQRVSIDDGPL